jgi:N-acetylmuramoyl-L-alanine amidase
MRRATVIGALAGLGVASLAAQANAVVAKTPSVAALQVALRARGAYPGPIDGIAGPLTRSGVLVLQRRAGIEPDGVVDQETRKALGPLGRPLLGQRHLGVGLQGWDVTVLEFRLLAYGLTRGAVDGRFTQATAAALRRFQERAGLTPDGIAGGATYRALATSAGRVLPPVRQLVHVVSPGEGIIMIARRYGLSPEALASRNGLTLRSVIVPGQRLAVTEVARRPKADPRPARSKIVHVVRPGESWFGIAQRHRVSPHAVARVNGSRLDAVIVPGQRLVLPAGAHRAAGPEPQASRDDVRASIDRWSAEYGVDPKLARAVAWMESGFQESVVSDVGALGVMQLLPGTWEWVDADLIGHPTPRTADGNVQAGVRFLRWQLDHFDGDVDLALAGWYQGARAVEEIGLYDDTKQFVAVVKALYGKV